MSCRGKGYGYEAFRAAIEYLTEHGLKDIYTQTWSGNERMIALAKKLGFVEFKIKGGIRIVNGEKYYAITYIYKQESGRHKIVDEEKRFKHKLNMLEPGSRMLKWIGILIVIGLLLYFFRFRMAAICVWAVSGIVFAVLLVLLAIESHQDKVLNEIAIEENKKNGEI